VEIAPDAAEDEDFGYSKARTTTKYGAIYAATLRAEANFPHLFVTRRWQTPGMRRDSLRDMGKTGSQRRLRES